jgi:NAD-dependent SIR2 family protein deacetylase
MQNVNNITFNNEIDIKMKNHTKLISVDDISILKNKQFFMEKMEFKKLTTKYKDKHNLKCRYSNSKKRIDVINNKIDDLLTKKYKKNITLNKLKNILLKDKCKFCKKIITYLQSVNDDEKHHIKTIICKLYDLCPCVFEILKDYIFTFANKYSSLHFYNETYILKFKKQNILRRIINYFEYFSFYQGIYL